MNKQINKIENVQPNMVLFITVLAVSLTPMDSYPLAFFSKQGGLGTLAAPPRKL